MKLEKTLQREYADMVCAMDRVETALLRALIAIVPGMDYHEIRCDESDWDGVSLELYGVTPVGLELSPAQASAVYALGFTVVRLYYEAPDGSAPRDGISDSMAGDWWAVKGKGARTCGHSVEGGGERGSR